MKLIKAIILSNVKYLVEDLNITPPPFPFENFLQCSQPSKPQIKPQPGQDVDTDELQIQAILFGEVSQEIYTPMSTVQAPKSNTTRIITSSQDIHNEIKHQEVLTQVCLQEIQVHEQEESKRQSIPQTNISPIQEGNIIFSPPAPAPLIAGNRAKCQAPPMEDIALEYDFDDCEDQSITKAT